MSLEKLMDQNERPNLRRAASSRSFRYGTGVVVSAAAAAAVAAISVCSEPASPLAHLSFLARPRHALAAPPPQERTQTARSRRREPCRAERTRTGHRVLPAGRLQISARPFVSG